MTLHKLQPSIGPYVKWSDRQAVDTSIAKQVSLIYNTLVYAFLSIPLLGGLKVKRS